MSFVVAVSLNDETSRTPLLGGGIMTEPKTHSLDVPSQRHKELASAAKQARHAALVARTGVRVRPPG
jgi:hypothetical protein